DPSECRRPQNDGVLPTLRGDLPHADNGPTWIASRMPIGDWGSLRDWAYGGHEYVAGQAARRAHSGSHGSAPLASYARADTPDPGLRFGSRPHDRSRLGQRGGEINGG